MKTAVMIWTGLLLVVLLCSALRAMGIRAPRPIEIGTMGAIILPLWGLLLWLSS